MSSLSRYVVASVAMFVILFFSVSHAAHMYYTGVPSTLSDSQVVMDGHRYPLSTKVKVILRVVGSNGAIHEKRGRLSDISEGNKVSIKVSNGEVTEIEKTVSR